MHVIPFAASAQQTLRETLHSGFTGAASIAAQAATPTATPLPIDGSTGEAGTQLSRNIAHRLLEQIPGWPQDNPFVNFLVTLVLWFGIAALTYWLLFVLLRRLVSFTRTDADNLVLRTIRVPVFIAVAAYGLVAATNELNLRPNIGLVVDRLYFAVIIGATFYLTWRIVKEVILKWLARQAEESESKLDDMLLPFLNTVGPLVIFLAALVLILQYLGVDVGLIIVSIGAVGLIIGLAFQESLSNLFSGIYLMVDPPFLENDLIILSDGKICGVQRVGLRMTQLYDMANHALIYTPNNQLANATISNISKPTVDLKTNLALATAFTSDPEVVTQLLQDILESHRNILGHPETKLATLTRRLQEIATFAGDAGTRLMESLAVVNAHIVERAGDDAEIHDKLLCIRKDMNTRISSAQQVLLKLQPQYRGSSKSRELESLVGIFGELRMGETEIVGMDESRMKQISAATNRLSTILHPEDMTNLQTALGDVSDLDQEENALEQRLETYGEAHEDELEALLQEMLKASENAAAFLQDKEQPKEAARIRLLTHNIAVQYMHREVLNSLEGFDRELQELIVWLRDLEAGGLTNHERKRIKALFSKWGGVRMLEKRRVTEMRRRIMNWLRWKEGDILPDSEYARLIASWERKLRQLARKMYETRGSDEDVLDTALTETRRWMYSIDFMEPITEWKLPGAGLVKFGSSGLEFNLSFYVDDIKLEHFSRQARVNSDVLLEIYETFKLKEIEIARA